jgi:predicted permease
VDTLLLDLRQAFRSFTRRPGLTAVAILTLAVGIGATTSIFSVVSAALFGSLGYGDLDRVVMLLREQNRNVSRREFNSYQEFEAIRDNATSFEAIGAYYQSHNATVGTGDEPVRVWTNCVDAGYFDALGAGAAIGRTFTRAETASGAEAPVAILSHDLWRTRFGGDERILERSITLDGADYSIVGVLPRSYRHVTTMIFDTEVYLPISLAAKLAGPRALTNIGMAARLRPGVTREQAEAEVQSILLPFLTASGAANEGWEARILGLRDVLVANFEGPLLALFGAAGLLTLIACANVANLLLMRGAGMRREMSVRIALGASRARLARLALTEGLMLAAAAGAAGALMAWWGTEALVAFSSARLPANMQIEMDGRVLALSLGLSLVTGLLASLAPAISASRSDPLAGLAFSARSTGDGRGRVRGALVLAELAVAVVVLVGAGLLVKSFANLHATSPGFRTERLLTLRVNLAANRYESEDAMRALQQRLVERAAAVEGVEAAVLWGPQAPGEALTSAVVRAEGGPSEGAEERITTRYHSVGAGALTKLGFPLVAGRDLVSDDRAGSEPVAVVSESLALQLWPGSDPLGRQLVLDSSGQVVKVVGVAADARLRDRTGRHATNLADLYLAMEQVPNRSTFLLMRTSGDPSDLAAIARQIVREIDPTLPISDLRTVDDLMADEERSALAAGMLMGLVSVVGLFLSSLGIYAVLAYGVSRRTREIGVRMALGARPGDVVRMVMREGAKLVVSGLALGVAAALALARLLTGLLYGVEPTDAGALAAAAGLLAVVATAACYLPARRATRVAPSVALRSE